MAAVTKNLDKGLTNQKSGQDSTDKPKDSKKRKSDGDDTEGKKQKLSFNISKSASNVNGKAENCKPGIRIKLGNKSQNNASAGATLLKPRAAIFDEEDEEEEEMPPEARMRMRNIGRDTPTSAGPNSFGKTKRGFCDSKKVFEKYLKSAMEDADGETK